MAYLKALFCFVKKTLFYYIQRRYLRQEKVEVYVTDEKIKTEFT